MLKAITLRTFPANMDWRECIRECAAAGFDGVEINFDGMFDLSCGKSLLLEIAGAVRDAGLVVSSVYSREQWQSPISSADAGRRQRGINAVRRLIEIASALESPVVLVIPGAVDNSILSRDVEITPYDEAYDRSGEALMSLAPIAGDAGVTLGIENVPGKFLLSPLEMRTFIDSIGSSSVGCYLDVANCLHNEGFPEQWIRILGKRIKNIHIKDYRNSAKGMQGFLTVFEGDVNWPAVCRSLAETGYDYALTSEVLPAFTHHPELLWQSIPKSLECLARDIAGCRAPMPRQV